MAKLLVSDAVARVAESLSPLGAVARTTACAVAIKEIEARGRQIDAESKERLARLENRRREASASLQQLRRQAGRDDLTAQDLRRCIVNMQRAIVRPRIALTEKQTYVELIRVFTATLLNHHSQQGDNLTSTIDTLLNGSGSGAPAKVAVHNPPLLIGYPSRVGLLLALTSAVSLVLVFRDDDARATAELLDLIGGVLVTAVLVLAAVRRWDRPWVEPVTVEAVRSEVRRGERMLRRVQADNAKLARLVAEVESKLAAAGRRQEFASLRNLHGESFGCADRVHDHYRSVQTSLHTMSSILGRVRYAARQPLGIVNRSLSHQARADAAEMKAAAAGLADATARVDADTQRQLDLVRRLNARTADLKHTIRDACGPAGERWYAALEERKAAARLAEGKPARR